MRYQDKTFTLPTCTKQMTQLQYDIAVGNVSFSREIDGRWILECGSVLCYGNTKQEAQARLSDIANGN